MGKQVDGKKLYIGNLPFKVEDAQGVKKSITADDLRFIFENEKILVLDAIVITDRETRQPKGFGFVTVADSDFEAALEFNGAEFGGREIKVSEAREKERK